METISISIIESETEIIDGIPKYITLLSNEPCNIFYTMDGSTPSINSSLALGEIYLPTEFKSVTIKYLATNGDFSFFGEYSWSPDKAVGQKLFSKVEDTPLNDRPEKYNLYPYGSSDLAVPGQFGDIALEPVNSPDKADQDFSGFGADQEPAGYTDKPLADYDFIAPPGKGERPNNLGSFNKAPNIIPDVNNISKFNSTTINKLFNPRAMVMYQDGTDPNVDPDISALNKQFYYSNNLESPEGAGLLITPASQGTAHGGSFLKYYINKKDQTIKFYYFDSHSCRWIISTEPYNMSNIQPESLAHLIFPPEPRAARHVYRWIPFVTGRYM